MHFPIHSPIEQIADPLFTEKQVDVFVKRDDMIHPFISGNKWRKLKYLLEAASDQNSRHLVTFGGAWSNHLLATACAAAKFGFKSTGFVRGEQVSNPVLSLCQTFGMHLIFTDRESYRDKRTLFAKHFALSEDAFFIDEGGASEEAVNGCAELIQELDRHYDHIICAAGTGTTAAGISKGLQNGNVDATLHVIAVLKGGGFLEEEIRKYVPHSTAVLHSNYHFGGYAKTTPELMAFIQEFSSSTGILAEPVYTGKMLYAMYDLVRDDTFPPGSKILAIHTGGLIGILGKI